MFYAGNKQAIPGDISPLYHNHFSHNKVVIDAALTLSNVIKIVITAN